MARLDLVADCRRCSALCCVATAFDASEDFAFDKPAGVRCQHLTADARCSLHAELAQKGFRGCALYDCWGAGQRATAAWGAPGIGERRRHEAFVQLRELHELLWLLSRAVPLCPDAALRAELEQEQATLEALPLEPVEAFLALDFDARKRTAHGVLRRVGQRLGGRRPAP